MDEVIQARDACVAAMRELEGTLEERDKIGEQVVAYVWRRKMANLIGQLEFWATEVGRGDFSLELMRGTLTPLLARVDSLEGKVRQKLITNIVVSLPVPLSEDDAEAEIERRYEQLRVLGEDIAAGRRLVDENIRVLTYQLGKEQKNERENNGFAEKRTRRYRELRERIRKQTGL